MGFYMCHKVIVTDNKRWTCFFSSQYLRAFYIFYWPGFIFTAWPAEPMGRFVMLVSIFSRVV